MENPEKPLAHLDAQIASDFKSNLLAVSISWSAANGGLGDGDLRKNPRISEGKRPFSCVFWIFEVLVAWTARIGSHDSTRESGDSRESEIRVT